MLTLTSILAERTCKCGNVLALSADGREQEGWYCCDEYFCSEACLDRSFDGTGETWQDHYSEAGDCYWTSWDLSDLATEAVQELIFDGFIDDIDELDKECETRSDCAEMLASYVADNINVAPEVRGLVSYYAIARTVRS